MQSFDYFYEAATKVLGSEKALVERLPEVISSKKINTRLDSEYLSLMCRRVFRSGLQHKMVDAKWPAFEKAYFGFDPQKIILLSDEHLDKRMQTDGVIKHWGKTKAIRVNAQLVITKSIQADGFGRWLSAWPSEQIVDLWQILKKEGAHLGGHSGSRFLRMAGVDTFLLSQDVVDVLLAHKLVDREPKTKAELMQVQEIFNRWSAQSGKPLAHVSRVVSFLAPLSAR